MGFTAMYGCAEDLLSCCQLRPVGAVSYERAMSLRACCQLRSLAYWLVVSAMGLAPKQMEAYMGVQRVESARQTVGHGIKVKEQPVYGLIINTNQPLDKEGLYKLIRFLEDNWDRVEVYQLSQKQDRLSLSDILS